MYIIIDYNINNDLDGCYIVFDTKKQEHGTGHPI